MAGIFVASYVRGRAPGTNPIHLLRFLVQALGIRKLSNPVFFTKKK
jgi:hypothetical protein